MNFTKLEAVNRVLRGAHEHPVSSLGSGSESDSLMAEQILNEVLGREQMHGLHINTVNTSFIPDSGNSYRVVLPDNTLQVSGANQHQHRNFYFREVSGQLRLFDGDKTPATDSFEDDEPVYIRITQQISFDDLPLAHQFAIADQAAVEYQMAVLGSSTMDRHLRELAAHSRAKARAFDMRNRPHNQFADGRAQGPRAGTRYVQRAWPYNDNAYQD